MMTRWIAGATLVLMSATNLGAGQNPPAAIRWEPYTLDVAEHGPQQGEIGRLRVPELRGAAGGKTIELGLVRLPGLTSRAGAPLVYLDGGPGGNGYGVFRIAEYYRAIAPLRVDRDVILLSQRGVGLSAPRLSCAAPAAMPDDFFLSAQRMTETLLPSARACAERWRAEGVNLAAYNTEQSADDVEDLRRALGVPKISLLGFSYGTHLAASVLRRHGPSIERAVLIGMEGPAHTWKYPADLDAQFARLAAAARGVDPDLIATWRGLLDRAALDPLKLPVTVNKAPRTIVVGAEGLQYLLRRDIGDTNDWPAMPAAIVEAARGNPALVGRLAARRFTEFSLGGGSLMAFAMDCASGASAERLGVIARQTPGSLLGVMTNYPFPEVCAALDLPALPASFRGAVTSDVPTLFISGTLDGHTPPSQAEEVAKTFSRATLMVVENAGHESSMPAVEVIREFTSFIQEGKVGTTRVTLPPIEFRR